MPPLQCHAAQNRLDAHLQLGHAEWLGQVIVGAALKAADTIRLGPQRRHHDHRCGAVPAQLRQGVQPIKPGQQDVHQHHIESLAASRFQALQAIAAPGDLAAATLQLFLQIGTKHRVVLDGKDVGVVNRYRIHWQLPCILNCVIIEHSPPARQPHCDQCLGNGA